MPTTNDIYLQRFDGAKWAEALGIITFSSTNDVGIGTSSPTAPLHVVNGGVNSPDAILLVQHTNLSQGISIGYNTIKSNGSSTNIDLNINAKGSGVIQLGSTLAYGNVRLGTNNIYSASGPLYLGYVNASNGINFMDGSYFMSTTGLGLGTVSPGAMLQANTSSASAIGIIVKGASSQTANLQEWQNSSGTILFKITSAGQPDLTSGGSYLYNGISVIRAQTDYSNFYFANGGNLTGSGSNNLAVGPSALQGLTSGTDNVAVGKNTLYINTSGARNVAMGSDAGYFTSNNHDGVMIGYRAGYGVTGNSHTNNVFVGSSSGRGVTTGSYNTFLGSQSGYAFATGSFNVAIGFYAMYGTVTTAMGDGNVVIGGYCLYRGCSSGENVAIGLNIGYNTSDPFSGYRNVFIGANSATKITSASSNTIVGGYACGNLTTGGGNVVMGYLTMTAATTASSNVALGSFALLALTTGDSNIGIGQSQSGAGSSITTGSNNIAIGGTAMGGGATALTGSHNVAIGTFSGYALQGAAAQNTFLGGNSGASVTTGTRNVIIGYIASYSAGITTGDDNVIIGTGTWSGGANSSNILAIGNYSYGTTIYGDFSTARFSIGNQVSSVAATLGLYIKNGGYIGLIVKGAASQTANLQEWQDSSGTVLSKVLASGSLVVPYGNSSFPAIQDPSGNSNGIYFYNGGTYTSINLIVNGRLYIGGISGAAITFSNNQFHCDYPLLISAYESQYVQTHDLVRFGWTGSSTYLAPTYVAYSAVTENPVTGNYGLSMSTSSGGTKAERFRITSGGLVGIGTTSPGAMLQANTSSASVIGVIIKGYASQSANLQEWQNSSGTILSKVTSSGDIQSNTVFRTDTSGGRMYFLADALTLDSGDGVRLFGIQTLQNNSATIHIRSGSGDGLKSLSGGGFTIENSASPDSQATLTFIARGTQLAPLLNVAGFSVNSTGTFVTFGHVSSASYPALKRSGTELHVRLADDSGFTDLKLKDLYHDGQASRSVTVARHTTSDTAGNDLNIQAGGATSGATDKAGGYLDLIGGISTGTGASGVRIKGYAAGASGTSDNSTSTVVEVLGNKLGLFAATPVVQPTTGITAATFTANTSGIADDTATWDGYTIGQIVAALRSLGALA